MDLWHRDVVANAKTVKRLCLLAPESGIEIERPVKLPPEVEVVPRHSVNQPADLRALLEHFDVVQFGSGRLMRQMRSDLDCARLAKSLGKLVVCGVSSDRAKTVVLNASRRDVLRRIRARMMARSILKASNAMARLSDGLFLVGTGLQERYGPGHANVHVGTASWISEEDVIGEESLRARIEALERREETRLCVATRLERMKGVHLALEALSLLKRDRNLRTPELAVYGEGPEAQSLQALSRKLCLENDVTFRGTVSYGEAFFRAIGEHDVMVLTNLNIEQPRLVFDAFSQGMAAICPDSRPYHGLGIDRRCLFTRGDANSLAQTIRGLLDRDVLAELMENSVEVARNHTIDRMHAERGRWIVDTLAKHERNGR